MLNVKQRGLFAGRVIHQGADGGYGAGYSKDVIKDAVNRSGVESNNGGRGFARNVERILQQELPSNHRIVRWFSQTKNKQARIYSNSAWVMQHIYYPEDWKNRWPGYHDAMIKYQREGKKSMTMDRMLRQASPRQLAQARCLVLINGRLQY